MSKERSGRERVKKEVAGREYRKKWQAESKERSGRQRVKKEVAGKE